MPLGATPAAVRSLVPLAMTLPVGVARWWTARMLVPPCRVAVAVPLVVAVAARARVRMGGGGSSAAATVGPGSEAGGVGGGACAAFSRAGASS